MIKRKENEMKAKKMAGTVFIGRRTNLFKTIDWEPVEYNGLWYQFAKARKNMDYGHKLIRELRTKDIVSSILM